MIKKVLTSFSMLISSVSFSQVAAETDLSKPDPLAQLEEEIKESCGHLIPETAEFKECVEIVSIDFTVFPYNRTTGPGCPGKCEEKPK